MIGSKRLNRRAMGFAGGCVSIVLGLSALSACGSNDEGGSAARTEVATSSPASSPASASTAALVTKVRQIGDGRDFTTHDSPDALGSAAALTVLGTVENVSDGRVFGVGPTRTDEPVFLAVTLTVHVDKVLAGDASLIHKGYVYVELPRSKVYPVEEFAKATPKGQRSIIFLSDYTGGRDDAPLLEKAPTVPAGAPILAPYTDGFLLEDTESGRLVGALPAVDEQNARWKEGTGSVNAFVSKNFGAQ